MHRKITGFCGWCMVCGLVHLKQAFYLNPVLLSMGCLKRQIYNSSGMNHVTLCKSSMGTLKGIFCLHRRPAKANCSICGYGPKGHIWLFGSESMLHEYIKTSEITWASDVLSTIFRYFFLLYLSIFNFQYFYFYSTTSQIQILYFYSTTFIWKP